VTVKAPFVIRNGTAKISTVEYAIIITKSRLVPSQNVQTLRTLAPAGNIQDVDEPVWVWNVTLGADWTETTGIAAILNTAAIAGDTLSAVIAPKLLGPNAAFDFKALAVDFGGDVGGWNTVDVSFPVVGQPVFDVDGA
jgi:hypothetical protein